MPFKIKNWKLALLTLVVFSLFCRLGMWQLHRAKEKEALFASFTQRTEGTPLAAHDLNATNDLRFYRVSVSGQFDNQHTILLDNKTFHGQVGYEVFSPFRVNGMPLTLLIDRGFVPAGNNRAILPAVPAIIGHVTISGMLNVPPTFASFGAMHESSIHFPLRIQFIQLASLGELTHMNFFPYIINLDPKSAYTFPIEWKLITMGPEKHLGYAVQWFAFALTLLILFVVLNCRRSQEKTK